MCDRLLAEGHSVVALDNFLTGVPANLAHLAGHPGFLFLAQTSPSPSASPAPSIAWSTWRLPPVPRITWSTPSRPSTWALSARAACWNWALEKNARFLVTSTSECYGDPLVHPQVETYWGNVNPVGPRSCYDESKRFAEALTMAYHRKHGVRTNIARIFNTYGPRMS